MERLVRVLGVLSASPHQGVSGKELQRVAGFDGDHADDQLGRDLKHLRNHGWQIDNIGGTGSEGRYRLIAGDNRLRVSLTPRQQAALQRAALIADRADLVDKIGLPDSARTVSTGVGVAARPVGDALATIVRAIEQRATLSFRYKGKERLAHPAGLKHQNYTWYFTGEVDHRPGKVLNFVVDRMAEVVAGETGSARRVPTVERLTLHPLRWEVDPPYDVTLRMAADFVPDAIRWLQRPRSERVLGDGTVELTYTVTNRAAMRARLYVLGTRVTVVDSDEFLTEVLAELAEMAGE